MNNTTNIQDIINNLWFANISIKNNVPEAEHTLESLDSLFPHLKIKSIKNDQDYKNIITTEILRLIGQLNNVSSYNSLTQLPPYENYSYGLSLNKKDNKKYILTYESDKTRTFLRKGFSNPSEGHIRHTIDTKNKAYKKVYIETPNINNFWCQLTLDGESINIYINRDKAVLCDYNISCTNIPTENMKIIEYFFHTFTKVLTLPEVEYCCLLVNDIIKKECSDGIDRINNIDTITKVLKDIQVQMLNEHPNIRTYLQNCSIQIPDFLEKKSSILSNNNGNNTTWLCNICNLCSSCLSSIYDKNTQKDV